MKNEKEIIICVGLGVMVVDTAEDAAAAETMDGAGIAVEITEEIPIGEVSTMVMPSATGMATMQEGDSQSGCGCSNNGGCGCGN